MRIATAGEHRASGLRKAAPAVLPALICAIFLTAPAPASAACEADYCTSVTTRQSGIYLLSIPAKGLRFLYPSLADCTWNVEAVYGDGTEPGEYTFSEATGLTASHTYPEPGTYVFHAYATKGLKDGTAIPCPDLHIEATVIFPEPPPPPPPEEPEGEPTQPPVGAGGPAPGVIGPEPTALLSPTAPYWRDCGGELLTHRVRCRKARQVVRAARAILTRVRPSRRLAQGAVFRVAGFNCRLLRTPFAEFSCRRGGRRILGPTVG